MKGDLFDVSFDPFKVVLKKPLHVAPDVYDVKRQVKRCLLEIKEWADRDIYLSWSGGFDGAFSVLSFLELVEEGKLPIDAYIIRGAQFTVNNLNICPDWQRGVFFLDEIYQPGMRVDLQNVNIDKSFLKQMTDICFELKQAELGWAMQEAWRRNQDELCVLHMGFPFPTYKEDVLVDFNTFNFLECLPTSPTVNIYQWNESVFSSFFTDFFLNIPYVPYNSDVHYDKYLWWTYTSQLHKMIYFLLCYPNLMKLFMKNSTWRGHLIKDPNIANFFSQSKSILITELRNESINCSMTLPNGEVVKSIEHSQEFFNGHS